MQMTPEEDGEEEQVQAMATSTMPGIDGGNDGTDDHHAEGSTSALAKPNYTAGSPIAKLLPKMVHAVLAQIDNLDLLACLFVCHTRRDAIADRAR
jgi:hypothetical protein